MINTSSFTSRLNASSQNNSNLSLSQTQYENWTLYALAQWSAQSGTGWDHQYNGTTSLSPCAGSAHGDGHSVIGGGYGCEEPGCTTLAYTSPIISIFGNRTEADICILGLSTSSPSWTLAGTSLGTNELDLVSVLVHEFGHALGIDDSNVYSVMHPGNRFLRNLYGDDIKAVRAAFPGNAPVERDRRYRRYDHATNSWDNWQSIPGTSYWLEPSGAVGYSYIPNETLPHLDRLVVASNTKNGDAIHFTRATTDPTVAPTWTTTVVNHPTWHRPAVASSGYVTQQWVSAWTVAQNDYNDCGYIDILHSSSDALVSGTYSRLFHCTNISPELAYDHNSDRFILAYIEGATPSGIQNRIVLRTSNNGGASWTSPQTLSISSLDTPSIACDATSCTMSYMRASGSDPWLVSRKINVNPTTGYVSLGNYTQEFTRLQKRPTTISRGINEWMTTIHNPGTNQNRANGHGRIRYHNSSSNPVYFDGFLWDYATAGDVFHNASLAGGYEYLDSYLLYIH
ncbi:matrixin family metalloprotease [Lujinxingia litoralis]